jgi:hypothetical protein
MACAAGSGTERARGERLAVEVAKGAGGVPRLLDPLDRPAECGRDHADRLRKADVAHHDPAFDTLSKGLGCETHPLHAQHGWAVGREVVHAPRAYRVDPGAGLHAARAALGLGAHVRLVGRHEDRVPALERELGTGFEFLPSTPEVIAEAMRDTDLLVGGVLLRGARAPSVVSEPMVRSMEPGSVIVDVSIDQGGCVETARPTSHSDPVFVQHGVTHYCVTNMPGAYPRTSTIALTAATLPYATALADRSLTALRDDPGLAKGVNVLDGEITCRAVAEALDKLGSYRAPRL